MRKNYKLFGAYYDDSAGVRFFVPDGEFEKGRPCRGFGSIKYPEGSVYTGDLFYDGKNFEKLGYGEQDFTRSTLGATDKNIGEKIYKFAGRYDYRKTEWIYGNGVLYYTYADGKPSHFIKGFFRGLDRVGDYKGEFDYAILYEGYTPDMEFYYDSRTAYVDGVFKNAAEKCERCGVKTLFIGDSYFGLADEKEFSGVNSFENNFAENCVNAGVNGSTFADWVGYMPRITRFLPPENIIINLGFNDLHAGKRAKKVFADYKQFISLLKGKFPESRLYLVQVVRSPKHPAYAEQEEEFNALTAETAQKLGVTVGEWNGLIENSGKNCFHADGVHPNEFGYGLFFGFIKQLTAQI